MLFAALLRLWQLDLKPPHFAMRYMIAAGPMRPMVTIYLTIYTTES